MKNLSCGQVSNARECPKGFSGCFSNRAPVTARYPSNVRTIIKQSLSRINVNIQEKLQFCPGNVLLILHQTVNRSSRMVMVGWALKQNKPINKIPKCSFARLLSILSFMEIQIVCTIVTLCYFVQQCFIFIPANIRIKRSVISRWQIKFWLPVGYFIFF